MRTVGIQSIDLLRRIDRFDEPICMIRRQNLLLSYKILILVLSLYCKGNRLYHEVDEPPVVLMYIYIRGYPPLAYVSTTPQGSPLLDYTQDTYEIHRAT